jgi:hypothetical protein
VWYFSTVNRDRVRVVNEQGLEIEQRAIVLGRKVICHVEVADAVAAFDPTWSSLSPRGQTRVVTY